MNMLKPRMNQNNTESKKKWVTGIGLFIWLLYLLSVFIPEPFWGIHYLGFLPPFFTYGILGLSLTSILYFHKNAIKTNWLEKRTFSSLQLAIVLAIIMSIFYYKFPMHESVYGDAELFQEKMGERTTKFSSKYTSHLFGLDFSNPKLGNTTVLSGVRLLSYGFGISHKQAFRIIGMFAGFWWVFILVFFLNKYIQNKQMRWLLMLMTLVAPFSQLFMGYEEVYAISFPIVAAYLAALLMYLRYRNSWLLFALPFLFLLCLKAHSVFILLSPSLFLALLYGFKNKWNWVNELFTWKKLLIIVMIPAILFGSLVYFFILKDYNDPRFLGPDVDIYTRLFLPIFSPEAPLDRYNLFSLNHVLDYFNMLFLWSGAGVFMLLVILLFWRKKIEWNKPEVVITGITLLLFIMVYFAYNPLMSMPMDFDLFSLGAPILLFFVFTLAGQLKDVEVPSYLTGSVLGLTLLVVPIYLVNADEEALSYRIESVGTHVFKTYWIRSAGDIDVGIEMQRNIREQYITRYLNVASNLAPYAIKGNDEEYAIILWKIAMYYRKEMKDYEQALDYHLQVKAYDNSMAANYIGLMEANYYLGRFEEAYTFSEDLIKFKYPDEPKAYRIAIDCAIQAKLYEKALQNVNFYLSKWDDAGIRNTQKDLQGLIKKNLRQEEVD